ncbi:hypothetical protein N0V82_001057 [Gnomoniopsis sp. IMI 355080]|nr:hypothetical protein N0V82_001057 [Gnomoniopsis sp. IMI 355080]
MASTTEDNKQRRALVDKLIELGTKASKPDVDAAIQQTGQRNLDELIQRTGTSSLIQALSFLVQPGRLPPQLRAKFLEVLTRIPLRPDGVRATAEFVFSVHPSSTVSSSEEAAVQKNGANITLEALQMATKTIAYPSKGIAEDAWYQAIAPQLFTLLDGQEGAEMMKVAAYVIGFGILGRKQSGSPGTAGWTAIAEPILRPINPSLGPRSQHVDLLDNFTDDIVDLSTPTVLVTAPQLAQALHRLQALLISHPNPSLSKRLLHRVILPLWAISSWIDPQKHCQERFCQPAQNLLKIYLKIAAEPAQLQKLIQNLLYKGSSEGDCTWVYGTTDAGEIQVVKSKHTYVGGGDDLAWDEVAPKVRSLIDLITAVSSSEDISTIFSTIFSDWFSANNKKTGINLSADDAAGSPNPVSMLIQLNVLQMMMDAFPSQLASHPDSIIRLVEPILKNGADGDDDETIPVALSLLNIVITAPAFQKSRMDKEMVNSIEWSLERIGDAGLGDASATARNLAMLMKYRDVLDDPSEKPTAPTSRQIEDRKAYNLALSYITQADSPPPVRAEGLSLLQTLINNNSSALDIPATLILMSSLLQDEESYINLTVIKIFTLLANKHPKTVTKELVERYVDADEKLSVDTRLRFGEAIVQVIERLGETFMGDTARQVVEALLSTAGRRGYRPKTEQKQLKDKRLKEMRQRRAEEEWGGKVPDIGDEETEEDAANGEILAQIVSGWDSKKGSEDIRIRASALSILAFAIETNVASIGPTLVTASIDLSANILTMEPGIEAGILRRSAVLVILSFVMALNKAKETGKRVGFGLTQESQEDIRRVLRYLAGTDNDELVRQHARDVIETLDNWNVGSLVSDSGGPESTLTKLAGLSVDPERIATADPVKARPVIEEIE